MMEASARNRIDQYTRTAAIEYNLLHVELAVTDDRKTFSDRDVHAVLKRSGCPAVSFKHSSAREWFRINLTTAINAIKTVKRGDSSIAVRSAVEPITFRAEQLEAIEMAAKIFNGTANERVLWNAKMRFGKTICALEVVRRCNFRRSIIVTHRPVVNDAWFDDFNKIFGGSDYRFGSKTFGEPFDRLAPAARPFVYFTSMQDLRGSSTVGGNFDKNTDIFDAAWDLVIVDEAHEGIKTTLGDDVISALVKNSANVLMLSGTPFNLIDDFDAARTFTWSYVDEQRAKKFFAAAHPLDHNPYSELPRLNIFTYDIGKLVGGSFVDIDDKAFDFPEFFRVADKNFVHARAVDNFINLLCTADNFPFANDRFRRLFKHTLWTVPGVSEAAALCRLLKNHAVFNRFAVVNVAGKEHTNGALDRVRKAINENARSITVSCRRLTVGVTVPEWTAVLMLNGSGATSAAAYMQTVFRVQSPCTFDGAIKTDCFVFDFAPDRTLKVIAAAVADNSSDRRAALDEFINFAPVIAFDGSRMLDYDVKNFFEQLKHINADKVFRAGFDSPLLFKNFLLDAVDRDAFRRLGKIIAAQNLDKNAEVNINNQGFDRKFKVGGSRKSAVDSARREKNKIIALLRAVAVRLPLLIYGADVDSDISIAHIASIVDDRSWEEFMPRGLDKNLFRTFVKYFDEDIFAAAARKILDTARAADDLEPDARAKKIAELFSTFKNPDKETVLTPWSIIDMHLSATVDRADFLSVDSTFLDINSKTGLYSLYLARDIWSGKMNVERAKKFGREPAFETKIKIWRETIEKNIFALCRTEMAAAITRRTLIGFDGHAKANIKCVENIAERLRDCFERDDFEEFVLEVCSKIFWKKGRRGVMKFDAVVGNPPYQSKAEGGTDMPLYHHFMEAAQKLADRATLIHPARFLFDAGATPKNWNKKILLDKHWTVVKYEPDSKKIFPACDIKGGIAITYYDAEKDFGSTDMFIPFDELRSMRQKVVVDNKDFKPLSAIIIPKSTAKLTEKLHREHPEVVKRSSKGHEYEVGTNIFDRLPEIFTLKKPDDDREYLKVYGLSKLKRTFRYVRRDYITEHPTIDKYKVFLPSANGSGALGGALSSPLVGSPLVGSPLVGSPLVGSPLVICTQTFITVGSFDSISEAEAACKYIKTKFCRAMLGILKVTQHNPPATWANVPLQDFTVDSDLDWSATPAELDRQLYKKYGLTPDEITFVEDKVKAMD